MNYKGSGRKRSWSNTRYYLGIFLEWRKITKTFKIASLRAEI
jgi:hypothetical protein